jgi:Asp-tRNA(Asn)/Glu-tRNA(Gln) amidotransferase A subunit family amidase
MNELLASFDLLMLPAAPIGGLRADADLSGARSRILRYTTPFSLAGLPAVTLPGRRPGTGVQIAAAASADPMLLAFAASCGGEAEWDVRGS